jgi:hypothetical protein
VPSHSSANYNYRLFNFFQHNPNYRFFQTIKNRFKPYLPGTLLAKLPVKGIPIDQLDGIQHQMIGFNHLINPRLLKE